MVLVEARCRLSEIADSSFCMRDDVMLAVQDVWMCGDWLHEVT
jgi:hypothetical protein